MELAVLFALCVLISGVAIRLAASLANYLGVVDRPGGHKQHEASTPFVGGVGILAVLFSLFLSFDPLFGGLELVPLQGILIGVLVLFLTGLADDIVHLSFKLRFVVQAMVALSMVFVGGVELLSFGELLPGWRFDLGWLSIPLTIFATVGLINAVNMIDGIDGLSGALSLVSLALVGLVAVFAGQGAYVVLVVALVAGVAGFLYYNLRYPGNSRARVFLGDNGSMVLGFLFAWLFIALSQGDSPAMTPVTALWLFALPLMDTVGVMLRRIWLRKSPFRPDRYHLHHLFVRAGYRVCDVVVFAALAQLFLGLIGVGGLLLGVPEYLMFWLFLGVFAAYFLLTLRPWRLVPGLRRISHVLGLPSVQVRGIFVGYVRREKFPDLLGLIGERLDGSSYDYQLSVYQTDCSATDGRNVYCVVHVPANGDEHLIGKVQRDVSAMKKHLLRRHVVDVRLFIRRQDENDLRSNAPLEGRKVGSQRRRERRSVRSTLIYSMERGGGMMNGGGVSFEVSVPPT
ncbi:MAG: undecaprenyl/decaprenyl-phosphate alpha-N-acetylglucosaminyl 1-phosphate transferase [Candidatus Accumulibacter meliphilus]|jgi:undecaprenyl-phosphate alpha-N-acetylglucosaminyl 1-phosphatetransferase|uniref:Undecaprenyl/decaprenyl-phosphate alpha-N-acetylglucosaminyl 1-phosphate transferase n=1 Tax=Candidatus Accumulibacter meliphilus TaxID=2211374 RepID=A0A369XR83_9PROT|nr:MAG: undecaprenyl/decaprenyl-phosphate alpha-N-acetylglucosaminyl 1-phosphate transferase [Candidatus Accumulibacter meliphilus]